MKNQMRDITSLGSDSPTQGRNYILAIAIDGYQALLHNPVADVNAIIGALTRRFTFEDSEETVKLLKNERATKMEVQKAFRRFRPDPESGRKGLTEKDTLVVIFAGHGDYDPEEDSGWWMPSDGKKEEGERVNFISDYEIAGWLNAIPAAQIILIVDACFGGRMLAAEGGLGFRRKNHLPAPYLLTSGGVEKVGDGQPGEHSPFAKLLLQALHEHPNGALSVADLGKKIALGMPANGYQRPWHGWLKGCGAPLGEIALHLWPDAVLVSVEAASLPSQMETMPTRLRENANRYYQRLRGGRFKMLHISDLILTESSPRFFDSTVRLDQAEETKSAQLPEMLQQLWQPQIRHILLMGDGGMGKTVASVGLWEQWLTNDTAPIPLFISLNEYNAVAPGDERTFLQDSLLRHYLDTRQPTVEEERACWKRPVLTVGPPLC